jgi:hypothetical protein
VPCRRHLHGRAWTVKCSVKASEAGAVWVRVKICDAAGYAIVGSGSMQRGMCGRNLGRQGAVISRAKDPTISQVLSSGLHHTGGVPRAAVEPLISSTAWTSSSTTTSSTHGHASASASASAAAPHFQCWKRVVRIETAKLGLSLWASEAGGLLTVGRSWTVLIRWP